MTPMSNHVCALAVACGVLLTGGSALGQPVVPPGTSPPADSVRWSAGLGVETVSLRDIARTERPVTASPIAWQGSGPAFRARMTRQNERRLHLFDVGGSVSGGFQYSGPLSARPTSSRDQARYFDARYEYRRYPFRNVIASGLDLGFGVEGSGAWTSFRRHIEPSTEFTEARINAGVGGSIAARLRRWDRAGAEVAWTNGLLIGRRHEEWTSGVEINGGGGGWVTLLTAHADVRVARELRVFAAYSGSGEGFLSSHRSYALGRRRLAMGVTLAR